MSRFSDFFAKLFGKKAAPVAPSAPLAPPASNVVELKPAAPTFQLSPRNPALDSTVSAGTSTVTGTAASGFPVAGASPAAQAPAPAPAPLVPSSDEALAAAGISRVGTGAPPALSNTMLSMLASGADPAVLATMAADHAKALKAIVDDAIANPLTAAGWFEGLGRTKFVTASDASPSGSYGPAPIECGRTYHVDGSGQAGSMYMEIVSAIQFADGTVFTPPGFAGDFAVPGTPGTFTTATLTWALTKNPTILAAMESARRTQNPNVAVADIHLTGGVYTLAKQPLPGTINLRGDKA